MTIEDVNSIRQRVIAGEDVSTEELREAIAFLRTSRAAAPATKEPKAAKSPKAAKVTLSQEQRTAFLNDLNLL